MAWLLILLGVFLALSPLLSAMPSRRQRQIARLREAAALGGLFVELRPPLAGEELGSSLAREKLGSSLVREKLGSSLAREKPSTLSPFYGLRWPRGRPEPMSVPKPAPSRYWRTAAGWQCQPGELAAGHREWLERMPLGISALVADSGAVGVFWDERGTPEDVRTIGALLRQWPP